jgi:hypothetical protein
MKPLPGLQIAFKRASQSARVFLIKVDAVKPGVDDERCYIICGCPPLHHGYLLADDGKVS